MYDYALNVLEAEAKTLENKMKDSLKAHTWFKDFTPIEEIVLPYQKKICDINDAIETLKSITGVDGVNNKGESDDKG